MRFKHYIPIIAMLAVVAALQLTLSAKGASYYMTQITMSVYYAVVAMSLSLLMGYAGQVSLGHAGFFAIGGYTAAFFARWDLSDHVQNGIVRLLDAVGMIAKDTNLYGDTIVHLSPWLGCAAALLIALAIALVIGMPVIRLRGHYLAMATLGFGIIVHQIVLGTPALGEADGFSDIPAFHLAGPLAVAGKTSLRVSNYYIAWFMAAGVLALGMNLVRSRVGRALRSIHENEDAAASLGVDARRYKLGIFAMSAVIAALAGVFLTHYNENISPAETTVMRSIRYVAIVAVGGMANLWGALIAGVTLNFLSLRGYFGSFDDAVFGAILAAMMLFAPNGIGGLHKLFGIFKRRTNGPAA